MEACLFSRFCRYLYRKSYCAPYWWVRVKLKPFKQKVRHKATLLLWSLRSTKFFIALSESLYWKQAYFQVFDGTSIERTIVPPSDGSGSI